jgi:hypothetical protein
MKEKLARHDIQHNDKERNDTQRINAQHYYTLSITTFSMMAQGLITLFIPDAFRNIVNSHECYSVKCHYAKSCYAFCQYGGFHNKLL